VNAVGVDSLGDLVWTRGAPLQDWSEDRIEEAHQLILETAGESYEPTRLRGLPTDPDFGNWVLLDAGELVGILWSMRLSDHRARVLAFSVDTSLQGDGYGTLAWSLFRDAARGAGMRVVQLEVRHDNEIALGMYERRGLRPRGSLKGFYRGLDGWLMLGPL
jgi:ribosomal protein S18 acetylase RimI-like enzyme